MTLPDFGPKLRRVREAHGHSQADLARAICADEDTVSRWERAKHKPQGRKLAPLLEFYSELAAA